MIFISVIVAVIAVIIALSAFQSVQNWEKQMQMEIHHLELRIDSLMEAIRLLNKDIMNLNK